MKYVFYGLMCVPILVFGIYLFVLLCKDILQIGRNERLEKEKKKAEEEKYAAEQYKKQKFNEDYDNKYKKC